MSDSKKTNKMTIIVLFNLKENREIADYEKWALATDLPIVRNLESIDRFDVFRCTGLLGGEEKAPYEYAESLDVNDMDIFNKEVSKDVMQSIANQFQAFADNPLFISTESIET